MIYRFAIDETGRFTLDENDRSYACGVLVSRNENDLRQSYKLAFKACGFGEDAPGDTAGLIGGENFHFSGMSDAAKKICRETLMPLIDRVIVSGGKPLLCANNQSFWFIAVASVIFELFKKHRFQKGDELKIEIDNRADKVWGLVDDGGDMPTFNDYHNILKRKIDKFIEPYRTSLGIRATVKFTGDTKSFFVNLADLACGFSRTTDMEKTECRCENFANEGAPLSLIDKNPVGALVKIFQETMNGQFENTGLIRNVFGKTRPDNENYNMVWDVFRNFLQYHLDTRYKSEKISKLNDVVEKFRMEFETGSDKLPVDKRLEIITSLTAYYSHYGAITMPVRKEAFIDLLSKTGSGAESRVTRKWEKYVSFCLRAAQIQFNGYNFGEAAAAFEKIWETHRKIIDVVGYGFDAGKDEPTAAIIGTLAQSYAFEGRIDEAIEYFKRSGEYATKTSRQNCSYLLTLHFIKQDIENVRRYFEAQTGGETPEAFAARKRPENEDVWTLLSYAKLRALELHKTGKTALPEIDISADKRATEYPYPLVLKWAAVAKHIENPDGNRAAVSEYLTRAADNLLMEGRGFAIRTLALPVIQVCALADNTNPYHAKYNSIADSLKTESRAFADFVEKRAPLLNQIKNDAGIWERANALPFNYS